MWPTKTPESRDREIPMWSMVAPGFFLIPIKPKQKLWIESEPLIEPWFHELQPVPTGETQERSGGVMP